MYRPARSGTRVRMSHLLRNLPLKNTPTPVVGNDPFIRHHFGGILAGFYFARLTIEPFSALFFEHKATPLTQLALRVGTAAAAILRLRSRTTAVRTIVNAPVRGERALKGNRESLGRACQGSTRRLFLPEVPEHLHMLFSPFMAGGFGHAAKVQRCPCKGSSSFP